MGTQHKQAVLNCVREMLWAAKTWNDHNFKPEAIRIKAKALAETLAIGSVDQANAFLDDLVTQLNK